MAKFVTFCQPGCGVKAEAPVHCRRCNEVHGIPNCDCGRPLRVIHIHACYKCTRTPADTSVSTVSVFDPASWPKTTTATYIGPPAPILRELPKIKYEEPVKAKPKEYVESWEYDKKGRVVCHEVHGFKKAAKS